MSKYIKGDKVVMEIGKYEGFYGISDNLNPSLIHWYRDDDLDRYAEPLSAYIEQARAEGQNEAWELARKILYCDDCGGMDYKARQEIFKTVSLRDILKNHTYPEAAAKVAQWEKAKEEIKVGDIYEGNIGSRCFVIRNIDEETNDVEILWLDLAPGNRGIEEIKHYKKTGRHIDIDNFLKQIGEEK